MAYKRKRTYAPRRAPFKRRRYIRRRTSYRRKRSGAVVGNTRPNPLSYVRRKRLSRRTFNGLLWKQTITATKYVSSYSGTGTVNTPATTDTYTTTATWALASTAGTSNFTNTNVKSLSGSIAGIVDPTETSATFDSDIIIRGGTVSFELLNNTETADLSNDIVNTRIVLCKIGPGWTSGASVDPFVPFGFDPDSNRLYGRVVRQWSFSIKDGETCKVAYKIPCQKVDIGTWANEDGGYIWYFSVGNGFVGSAQTVTYRKSWSVTFCGDAIS